jgi:hypothetical protein
LITLSLAEAQGENVIDLVTMREAEALAAKLLRVASDHTSAGRHGDSEVVGDAADALLSLLDEWVRQQRN